MESLPKVDVPTYEIKLPSSGQEITVRPFLVKEEKLLLMAAESKDTDDIIKTTKQVIKNCILSEGVDIDKLPFFDIDYLFIALRAKSISETVELQFKCEHVSEEGGDPCGFVFNADLDISNCEMVKDESVPMKYDLGGLVVTMKYPSYAIMKSLSENDHIFERKIKTVVNSIDMIQKGNKVYKAKDYTPDELTALVEGLREEQFKKLENFIDNFPYFRVFSEKTCPRCKFKHRIEYSDFSDFFY